MTVTADMLRKLGTLSLSSEQMAGVLDILAEFAEADEEEQRKAEERRAKDRERKRKSAGNPTETERKTSAVSEEGAEQKEIPPTPPKEKLNNINNLTARVREAAETADENGEADGDGVSHEAPPPKKTTPRQELERVLSTEHAEAVLEHRKKCRKPLTARGAKLLAEQFKRAPPPMTPDGAADLMVMNGWQGFRPEYVKNDQRSGTYQGRSGMSSRVLDLVREVNAYEEDGGDAGREPDPGDGFERRRALGFGRN